MTSQGSAYARFRRALDARNPAWASTAALELPRVGVADAIELTLIYLDKEPAKYERAALRLHARLTADLRLGLEDSLALLGLLTALRGRRAHEAAHALASFLPLNQTFMPASTAFRKWAVSLRLAGIDSPELPLRIVRAVGSRRRATRPFYTSTIPDKVASTPRQEDRVMSIVVRFNPTDKPVTADKYDEAVRRHEEKGIALPPDGMEYHVCFGSAENIRVSEIWDSREQWEAYGEQLMPLLAEVGIEPGEPEVFEVHNIISR